MRRVIRNLLPSIENVARVPSPQPTISWLAEIHWIAVTPKYMFVTLWGNRHYWAECLAFELDGYKVAARGSSEQVILVVSTEIHAVIFPDNHAKVDDLCLKKPCSLLLLPFLVSSFHSTICLLPAVASWYWSVFLPLMSFTKPPHRMHIRGSGKIVCFATI